MQTKLPDSLIVTTDDDNPDKEYKKQIKYHRNTIEKLNHLFRIWTHQGKRIIVAEAHKAGSFRFVSKVSACCRLSDFSFLL